MNELILILLAAAIFSLGFVRGKRAGIIGEWTRLNERDLERWRKQRNRDGRTRDFKRAKKSGGAK